MNDSQSQIPSSKIQRAGRFVKAGAKVGGNYLKHYSKKLVQQEVTRADLDEKNAKDIYDALSELKGSALKVAQMLSMDQGILPEAFAKQFAQSQHKAPPLSGPLIVKTFRKSFGESPQNLFDSFDMTAAHAASIGQVHLAEKDGKKLAIKIQYPGVGASVVSDLNLVQPIARRMFGWKEEEIGVYFGEVRDRLVEETDYQLELERSLFISDKTKHLEGLTFAKYYPEYSSDRVITMSWLQGLHLEEWLAGSPDQEAKDRAGQALWDFYQFQIHELRLTHADAHPGNFLVQEDGTVGILDFGCVKEIPEGFYKVYFQLLDPAIMNDEAAFIQGAKAAQVILDTDSPEKQEFFLEIFREALSLVCQPFHQEEFDFGDPVFLEKIYEYGNKMGKDKELRSSISPRGDKDGIYLNRTFFGLFSILSQLGARVKTRRFIPQFLA